MQRQLTLGFVVVATVWLGACSDQEVDPRRRNPPIAAAGAGGGAGSGSMAQGGTGGATGGSAGTGGTPSGPAPCTGCVELVVPVSPLTPAAMQQAMFNFVFTGAGVDMSNGLITFRVRSKTVGADLFVTAFAQNGAPDYPGVYRPQTLLTEAAGFSETDEDTWIDIVLDLANTAALGEVPTTPPVVVAGDAGADAGDPGTAPPAVVLDNGGMDKSAVIQLGLQVGALPTLAAPDTITLLIDSVTFGGVTDPQAATRDFNDNTAEGFGLTNYMIPPGTTGPTPH